jgi:hypothetical protein
MIEEKIEKFYNEGYGKRASSVLRNGACMELRINREVFSLRKDGGRIKIEKGVPRQKDALLQFRKDSLEYIIGSRTEDELKVRLMERIRNGEIIFVPFLRKGDESTSVRTLAWKGYIFWARRMRFVP